MEPKIKKRYLRLVRRAYRLLKSPRLRKHGWLQRLIAPIFDRGLWHPCRDTVAAGLAVGLAVAMLPILGQMVVAAVAAMRLKGNVPIAIAACWVTNPATQLFIMRKQELFGKFLHESIGFPLIPFFSNFEGQPPPIMGIQLQTMNAGSFITGFLASAVILFFLAYPLVYLLSALMPKLLPRTRYQRAKAKVLARKETEKVILPPPS